MHKLQLSRLNGLDTLRAIAIVSVMIYHLQDDLPHTLEPIAKLGWMGVDLFFVLSGFLIGTQLLKPYAQGGTLGFKEFYTRRAYRILPAYLTVLLLYFVVPAWREAPGLAPAWKFLTFTWNLLLNFPAERAFSHAWSLCVEEHFYLLLPVLIIWQMRKPATWKTISLLTGVVLFGLALRSWELFHVIGVSGLSDQQAGALFMKRIYYLTFSRLDGLVAGVALAILRIFRPQWWARVSGRGNVLLILGLFVSGAAIWMFRGDYPSSDDPLGVLFGFPLLALGFGFLVASGLCPGSLMQVRVPGAAGLATLAYSLYLTHKEVAHLDRVLFPWLQDKTDWQAAAMYAASCLSIAAVLYFGVERPFLALRARRLERAAISDVDRSARLDPAL